MSSLPAEAKGTTTPKLSSSVSRNPNPNHGDVDLLQPLSVSPLRPTLPTAGSWGRSAVDTGGSTEKVNGLGTAHTETTLTGQNTSTSFDENNGGVACQAPKGAVSARYSRKSQATPSHGLQSFGSGNPYSALTNARGKRTQIANGNHLLNFHYDPIARPQTRAPPPRRPLPKVKPYNKDLFLQANYKFVVLDSGNYSLDLTDPDKMLQWENIICVKYSTPFPVHCPICLEQPLCPQITSCGHIFCFPCILQYLLMGKEDQHGESWKRCPLCFVMISPKDLYTIYIESVKQYVVGDTIEFMLLTRQKDSLSVFQKNKPEARGDQRLDEKGLGSFSKFTFTTDVDLSVRQAISDLESWLVRADSGLVEDIEKLPYVCASMTHLEQRKKHWNSHHGMNLGMPCKESESLTSSQGPNRNLSAEYPGCEEGHPQQTEYDNYESSKLRSAYDEAVVSSDICDTVLFSSHNENKKLPIHSFLSADARSSNSYNFYQAVDGQHFVLHPLNMKCLLHHYGSYDMLPNSLNGKILELETVTQTEAVRRRYRYLSHFSLTTTFQLCEIDLSKILPPESLTPFMDEIRKRENQRKKLSKKEQKEKVKAKSTMTEYYVPRPSNYISPPYDEPPFSLDDFEALGTSLVASSSSPPVGVSPVARGKMLFSNVTKLGYAAGSNCIESTQKSSEATSWSSHASSSENVSVVSFANVISRDRSTDSHASSKVKETGKKGKKASRVLLSTSGGRRY